MKTIRMLIMGACLTLGQGVSADPLVELVWAATSGSGSVPSDTIRAKAGDFLVLDVFVLGNCCTNGLVGASLGLSWDGTKLLALGAEECPDPPNFAPGVCSDSSGTLFLPTSPGVTLTADEAIGFDAGNVGLTSGYDGEVMHLGRIDFLVTEQGNSEVVVEYRPGIDGIIGGDFAQYEPDATATIQPPGCF